MKNHVVMVRTIGGEFIIGMEDCCDVVDNNGDIKKSEDKLQLKSARMFSIQMTHQGTGIAFIPVFPFCTSKKIEDIELNNSSILIKADEKDIDGEIVNGYKSNISGIDLSASNKVIL